MTLKYKDLEGDQAVYSLSPRISSMMTGVKQARQTRDGTIELTYIDGSTESYKGSNPPELSEMTILEAVSFVQSHRREVQP